jgi:hypothetical protein
MPPGNFWSPAFDAYLATDYTDEKIGLFVRVICG